MATKSAATKTTSAMLPPRAVLLALRSIEARDTATAGASTRDPTAFESALPDAVIVHMPRFQRLVCCLFQCLASLNRARDFGEKA